MRARGYPRPGKLISAPAPTLTPFMLEPLSIRDIVLIERLDIDFRRRPFGADRRDGRRQIHPPRCAVAGARRARRRFAGAPRRKPGPGSPPSSTCRATIRPGRILAENAIDDDGDIILRRVQTADGRTRVFVNDQPSSVTPMRDIGRALVEIHGQHDDRALVDAAAHRDLLDAFGGHVGEVARCGKRGVCWRAARAGAGAAPRQRRGRRPRGRLSARLGRRAVASSTRSRARRPNSPKRRAAMMRAEKIASEIKDAQEVAVRPALAAAAARRPAAPPAAQGRRGARHCWTTVGEVPRRGADRRSTPRSQASTRALRATEYDPQKLESTEERLFALRAAARKHSVAGRRPRRSCATRWRPTSPTSTPARKASARAGKPGRRCARCL